MATKKSNKIVESSNANLENCIVFNGKMRKTFVEGVFQDIKGYFENKTDGLVKVSYEDYDIKDHEFGFKLYVTSNGCKRQVFNEVSDAIVNIVSYMFAGDMSHYDIAFSKDDNSKLEVEFVSNW